jgi:hypothetical protein
MDLWLGPETIMARQMKGSNLVVMESKHVVKLLTRADPINFRSRKDFSLTEYSCRDKLYGGSTIIMEI